MSLARSADWMNATGAFFQTRTTIFTASGSMWEVALTANPQRWALLIFDPSGGSLVQGVMPGPVTQQAAFGIAWPTATLLKWFDSPSMVTGPWVVNALAGGQFGFTETLYVGP